MTAVRAFHRRPIFAADVRQLGGVVSVSVGRDRVENSEIFQVAHVSRGGDCFWRSSAIHSEDDAYAAARVLAEFVGGVVR